MLKGLMIHSARDIGPKGPDYSYGYGIIDAQLGADVIKNANVKSGVSASGKSNISSSMVSGSLDNKKQKVFKFKVPSSAKEFRATLVWHDQPGSKLVNDLDLWVVSPKKNKVLPFTLNSKKPTALAQKKRNSKDNVEHILVNKPDSGNWKVYVKGYKVPKGPQDYALIISASPGNDAPQIKTGGSLSIGKAYAHSKSDFDQDEKSNYSHGDQLYLKMTVNVSNNTNWGSFNGTISIKWEILKSGKTIFKRNSTFSTVSSGGWYLRTGPLEIPNGMAKGTYQLKITAELYNGDSDTNTFQFSVK